MRVYVTWAEFSRIVEPTRHGRRMTWGASNCFDAEQLARIYDAEARREPIELVPSVDPPPFRVAS